MVLNLLNLVNFIVTAYVWTLIAYVISSWLISFKIINPYQPLVRWILGRLYDLHEPVLAPIRRFLFRLIPNMGGLDLSPLVACFGVELIIAPMLRYLIITIFA